MLRRILGLVFVMMLLGCGADKQQIENRPTVALVLKTLNNPFFIDLQNGAQETADSLGVTLVVQAPDRELDVEKQMQIIENLIQRRVSAICGKLSPHVNREKAVVLLIESLTECADYAEKFKVKLVIEPINRYETDLVNIVAEGLDLIEKVAAENLDLLLDTFHMNIEEPSIFDSVRRAGRRIFHFHVADSNRWYPGAGHIDFKKVVQTLKEAGYDGFVSAEILPLPDPDTCAQKTIATMKPLLKGV